MWSSFWPGPNPLDARIASFCAATLLNALITAKNEARQLVASKK